MRYYGTELTNLDTNADLFAMMSGYCTYSSMESAVCIGSGRRSDFLGVVIFDKASLIFLITPDIPLNG